MKYSSSGCVYIELTADCTWLPHYYLLKWSFVIKGKEPCASFPSLQGWWKRRLLSVCLHVWLPNANTGPAKPYSCHSAHVSCLSLTQSLLCRSHYVPSCWKIKTGRLQTLAQLSLLKMIEWNWPLGLTKNYKWGRITFTFIFVPWNLTYPVRQPI